MNRLFLIGTALLLGGCAQWETMDSQQKNLIIATTLGAAVIGYYANDGDNITIGTPPAVIEEHNTHNDNRCKGKCGN